MTDFSGPAEPNDSIDAELLFLQLRRKQGNWVEWGQFCQTLQKAGYSPQAIFEETGFEPIQQNQVIVAAQVYQGFASAQATPNVLEHFSHRGSDILYEFRILTQADRVAAATFALDRQLDSDEAHDVAKAIKDFSRLSKTPEGFSAHPGDAIAYQAWSQARQKSDLQDRSRLIAKGLRYVQSESARKELEKLLVDFSVTKVQPAPRLPLYRLESGDDLPRILPLVGQFPLPVQAFTTLPGITEEGPFRIVNATTAGSWITLPGWQVLLAAEDPVALLCKSDRLPFPPDQPLEDVVIVVDRAQQRWDRESYFVWETEGQLEIQWFEQEPSQPPLGRMILVIRPKRILDEGATRELWQVDE